MTGIALYQRPLLTGAITGMILALGSDISAQTEPAIEPAVNLMAQGRNFKDLNVKNFDPQTLYTVAAPSQQATQFRFKLKGYVFGLRMIKANFTGYIDGERYAAYTDLKTSGLGALLKKLEIWAVTRGQVTPTKLHPDFHVQQNMDKKNRRVEMNYDNGAQQVDVAILPPLGSQGVPPASPKERFEAHDTISAILSMTGQGKFVGGRLCDGSVPVFDSKQHYNLRMERSGTKRVKYKKKKVDTIKCNVYYEPISGFDPEDLPDPEESATPVKVYFMTDESSALHIPVRFTYKISSIKAVIKLDDMTILSPENKP